MTAFQILTLVAASLIMSELISPDMRRRFRAWRRLRARKKRNPVLEKERLLQLEHWQKVANDARKRMSWCVSEGLRNAATQAENEHQHAQNKIKELAK